MTKQERQRNEIISRVEQKVRAVHGLAIVFALLLMVGCEDAALPQQQQPVAHAVEGNWEIVGVSAVRPVPHGEEIEVFPMPSEYEGQFMLNDGVFELRQRHTTGAELDRKLGTYFIDEESHQIIVSVQFHYDSGHEAMVLAYSLNGTERATFRMTSDSITFGTTGDGRTYTALLYAVERLPE